MLVITIIGIQAGFIDDLYKEHNRYRRQYGLPSLKVDKTIEYYLKKLRSVSYSVGHNHAQSQNLKGENFLYFSTNSAQLLRYLLLKISFIVDYNRLCTGYIGIRENIYWGYKLDARKVMDAWKRSSGHNRNLLTANVSTFFEIFIFSNLLP